MTTEVVICRFAKQLEWAKEIKWPVIVYDKGHEELKHPGHPNCEIARLPNISYEDYVILWHIIDRWDKLADFTVFLQDDAPEGRHAGEGLVATINEGFTDTEQVTPLFCDTGSDLHREYRFVDHGDELPIKPALKKVYEELFGWTVPVKIKYVASALIAVPVGVIKARPQSFYVRAREVLEREFVHWGPDQRPMVTWVFERLWLEIFRKREAA